MVKVYLQYSANDVLVLECDGKEVLIPFLETICATRLT